MNSKPPAPKAGGAVSIGIVASEFNSALTEKMLEAALAHAPKAGASVVKVMRVPGAFDTPIAAKHLLSRSDVEAVVVLGAIVTGETKHDEVIAHAAANALARLSLEHSKPVAFGISGPGMTVAQGEARAVEYAHRSVQAAVELSRSLRN